MVLPLKDTHPKGDAESNLKKREISALVADTFAGKIHIEWDPQAQVTPLGQLPFFIQFLKIGGRFDPWIDECPLVFNSNNAPKKVDVLGSLFLSILSGHKRYAHITSLMSDGVNPALLGMNKIVSEDSARRAVKKIEENIKDSINKIKENIQTELKLKDDLQRKYIRDSIIKTLVIGSDFEYGIVINFQNNNTQAILLSKDEFYIRRRDLIEAMNELRKDGLDWNKWQIPTYGNMVYVAKLLKTNKNVKKIFFETKLVDKEVNNSNFYWSDTHYLQLFGSGTFNILISYDMPLDAVSYTQNAFLRYIRIAKLN